MESQPHRPDVLREGQSDSLSATISHSIKGIFEYKLAIVKTLAK